MTEDHSTSDAGKESSAKWLGYELHDGLMQWIVAASMRLQSAVDQSRRQGSDLTPALEAAQSLLDAALDEGRQLIGFLERPTPTAALDLGEQIGEYIDAVSPQAEAGDQCIRMTVDIPEWPNLPSSTRWNLLRVAQQAIRNAVAHAGPTLIHVSWTIDADDRRLALVVQDWGRGFDATQPPPAEHFGLESMRHRARIMGGSLDIHSAPGDGCRVVCRVPLG